MHLCGIYYLRGSSHFFEDARDEKIDLRKVLVKKRRYYFSEITGFKFFS